MLDVGDGCVDVGMVGVGGTDGFQIFVEVQQELLQIGEIGMEMRVIVDGGKLGVELQEFDDGVSVEGEE
ncbi:hypothetical protein, partial [Paenibacillus sp. Y412MC10]|uniref:hypothetical protein n=1 Tax=Geobacillus sp. (strain Y412MC10) TaxID=481743 RepID=UPI001642FE7E